MSNITLNAPTGISSFVGNNGTVYPVTAGAITVPANVAQAAFAAGFYYPAVVGGTGGTGATGLTGGTGGTGSTGSTGSTGATGG